MSPFQITQPINMRALGKAVLVCVGASIGIGVFLFLRDWAGQRTLKHVLSARSTASIVHGVISVDHCHAILSRSTLLAINAEFPAAKYCGKSKVWVDANGPLLSRAGTGRPIDFKFYFDNGNVAHGQMKLHNSVPIMMVSILESGIASDAIHFRVMFYGKMPPQLREFQKVAGKKR